MPTGQTGTAGLAELSRILEVPYGTLYAQVRAGRLKPIPGGEGRAKFNINEARDAQVEPAEPRIKKAPRVRSSGGGKGAGKRLRAESATEKAGKRPAAPISIYEAAALAAFKAFKKCLLKSAQAAHDAGERDTEIAALRAVVSVDRKAFMAQLVESG